METTYITFCHLTAFGTCRRNLCICFLPFFLFIFNFPQNKVTEVETWFLRNVPGRLDEVDTTQNHGDDLIPAQRAWSVALCDLMIILVDAAIL